MTDTAKLAAALVAAQAEMPAVEPNAVNPHFKSKFVSLDHLIAKTRPVMNKHGLAIVQAPAVFNGNPALETRIIHISGEYCVWIMPLLLTKQDMQGLGAAITYARRYAWAAALGIAGEEDDDGEQASEPEVRREDPRAGQIKRARGWADWEERMVELLGAREDVNEWLRQACAAIGIESLSQVSSEERKTVFNRANRLLMSLAELGTGFPPPDDETVRGLVAEAFDGAVVEGPSRIEWPERDEATV